MTQKISGIYFVAVIRERRLYYGIYRLLQDIGC
jgi:hypothetical protein